MENNSLFPSVSVAKTEDRFANEDGLKWLSNQSFPLNAAQSTALSHDHAITLGQHIHRTLAEEDTISYRQESSSTFTHHPPKDYRSVGLPQKREGNTTSHLAERENVSEQLSEKGDDLRNGERRDCSGDDRVNPFDGNASGAKSSRVKRHEKAKKRIRDESESRSKEEHHSRRKKKKKTHHGSETSPERYRHRKRHKKEKRRPKQHKKEGTAESESFRKRHRSIWIDDIGSVPSVPFYLDEKADKNNLCFSSLNFTDVAFYRRLGRSCLGIDHRKEMVLWEDTKSRSEKHSKKQANKPNRYFEKMVTDTEAEIIPVLEREKNEGNKKKGNVASDIDYVPIPDPLQPLESSMTVRTLQPHPTDGPKTEGFARDAISVKIAFFNEHLRECPHDIPTWLEFVDFQDQAAVHIHSGLVSTQGSTTSHHRRARFVQEKKLSILEKALRVNPSNPSLQIEHLELCRESWDTTKLAKHWQTLIRQHKESLTMWQDYLAFHRSCFTKFAVSRVVSLYNDYLLAMHAQSTHFKFDLVMQVCHFWRQSGHTEKAVALLQAMVEFNCFCPQHLEDSTTLDGKIAFFEPFWDSNEPRFGQAGAEGWNKWMHRKEKGGWSAQKADGELINSKDTETEEETIDGSEAKWQAWLKEEGHREHNQFLPWQPGPGQTDDDCEDPDRMVLFDDISSFLLNLDTQEQKFELILGFLDFLGVYRREGAISVEKLEHPGEVLGCEEVRNSYVGASGLMLNGRLMMPLSGVDDSQGISLGVLRGRTPDVKAILQFADNVVNQAMHLFQGEAPSHLLLLQMHYNLQPVDLLASPKQQRICRKGGQRYAKRLLSQESNRNNLRLWEEYARWEWSGGNEEEGLRILETTLAFSNLKLTPDGGDVDVCRLLSTYATLKLRITADQHAHSRSVRSAKSDQTPGSSKLDSKIDELNQSLVCKQEVLHALTCLGEGAKYAPLSSLPENSVSAARILKARIGYVQLYNRTISSYKDSLQKGKNSSCEETETLACLNQHGSHLVHIAQCYALFQYLSVSMQAAGVVFEETLSTAEGLLRHVCENVDDVERGVVHRQLEVDTDMLMTSYVRVFSHHVRSHPIPVLALRNLLHRALKRNGTQPELLEALINLEARSHITGRLRRYFDKATSESKHPVPWLYAIWAEMKRQRSLEKDEEQNYGRETGVTHRLRSLFERATSNRDTRHCVLLWRLYMQFEVEQGDLKRGKAIFYKALQHCPWAKILYLDAVRYFPDELQEVLDLLMEKELRVRVPIEEVELLMGVARNKHRRK